MKVHYSQSSHHEIVSKEADEDAIMADIAKTRYALETAYSGFDNATDPDLIDCYIYEMNAVFKRYKYLLEQAAKLRMLPESSLHQETSVSCVPR